MSVDCRVKLPVKLFHADSASAIMYAKCDFDIFFTLLSNEIYKNIELLDGYYERDYPQSDFAHFLFFTLVTRGDDFLFHIPYSVDWCFQSAKLPCEYTIPQAKSR